MIKFKIKQRVIFSTVFIIISLLLIIFLIILPTVNYINSLKKNIQITETEIEESYQRISLLKNSINQVNEIKNKVEPFYFLTLNEGEELIIIKELERLALENNILQSLDVNFNKNSNNQDGLVSSAHYVFKIKISGKFIDLLNYLDDLEELPYYFLIDQMSISKEKNSGDTIAINFTALLNATTAVYSKVE